MKALVYTGTKTLVFRDVEDPEPDLAAGEVLIRVESVGICGSDIHAYLGHDARRPPPLILGHEAAGTIVEGKGAGQRVTVNPLVTCMKCRACRSGHENICAQREIISMPPREGAFAEFLKIPARNLIDVPDHVDSDKAALTEPIACGWHAIRLAATTLRHIPVADMRILVLGGGAIGLGAALAASAMGARDIVMIEPHPARRGFLSGKLCFPVKSADMLDGDEMFDLVVDAVGIEASRANASARIRPGGVIAHIGLGEASGGLDIRRLTLQEITFIGSYTYTRSDFNETAQAIFDGRLGPLDWVEKRPLETGAQAFRDLREGRVEVPKILLKPNG